MAYIKELDRKCAASGCSATAVVEVLTEDFKEVGKFCRRDGQKAAHAQTEKERTSPKPQAISGGAGTRAVSG